MYWPSWPPFVFFFFVVQKPEKMPVQFFVVSVLSVVEPTSGVRVVGVFRGSKASKMYCPGLPPSLRQAELVFQNFSLQPSDFSLPAAQAAVCDGSVPGCDGICDGFTHA